MGGVTDGVMNAEQYIAVIDDRLNEVYSSYQQGKDVPPVKLYRLEGNIESVCIMGFLSLSQAKEMIKKAWDYHIEAPFPESQNDDIIIPIAMKRAPVVPSTKE